MILFILELIYFVGVVIRVGVYYDWQDLFVFSKMEVFWKFFFFVDVEVRVCVFRCFVNRFVLSWFGQEYFKVVVVYGVRFDYVFEFDVVGEEDRGDIGFFFYCGFVLV